MVVVVLLKGVGRVSSFLDLNNSPVTQGHFRLIKTGGGRMRGWGDGGGGGGAGGEVKVGLYLS